MNEYETFKKWVNSFDEKIYYKTKSPTKKELYEIAIKQDEEIERLKEENTILKQTMSNNSLLINENAFLKERIDKAIEYIENEMPCLWEVDDVWEDIDGNYQHNYKEYDTQILLNKLKGVDKE